MPKKTYGAALLATLLAAGCGGSGGSAASPSPQSITVAGPLDPVQTSLGTQVFAPLSTALANTPLQGVLLCADSVVTQNTLDIADAFANGLASPTTLSSTTPAQAQAALTALVGNLSGLLTSLAGGAGCTGSAGSTAAIPTTNPLAGTPLEPLGAALLPALISAQQQLTGIVGGSTAPLSAMQLTTILTTLRDAYNEGIAQLPSTVTAAPIVGGTLLTVQDALAQLSAISADAVGGTTSTVLATELQLLAQTLLDDLLTQVVPVQTLQAAAGTTAVTDLVAQIEAAVATLTAPLATGPNVPLPTDALGQTSFSSLQGVITQLGTSLPTGLSGTSGQTPLDAALGALTALLDSLVATTTGGGCLLGFLGLC